MPPLPSPFVSRSFSFSHLSVACVSLFEQDHRRRHGWLCPAPELRWPPPLPGTEAGRLDPPVPSGSRRPRRQGPLPSSSPLPCSSCCFCFFRNESSSGSSGSAPSVDRASRPSAPLRGLPGLSFYWARPMAKVSSPSSAPFPVHFWACQFWPVVSFFSPTIFHIILRLQICRKTLALHAYKNSSTVHRI